jgi:Icc-related predicted phosphoesterase
MKIVHISDTHGLHREIDLAHVEADVLVHSGDFLTEDRDSGYKDVEFEAFVRWLAALPVKHKILVAGNHDWYCFEAYRNKSPLKQLLLDTFGIHYLEDDELIIDGVKFYGSPWQPEFMNWAYNLPINGVELQQKWQMIPDNTQVLITHGPAFGHLDVGSPQKRSLGCELLRLRIDELSQLKLHLFGHIHEAYGAKQTGQTHFYNSAYLNVDARFGDYPPIIDFNIL